MRKVIERHERRKSQGDEQRKDTSLFLAFGETHSSQRLTSIPSGQIPEHLAASNILREDGEGEREDPVKARGGAHVPTTFCLIGGTTLSPKALLLSSHLLLLARQKHLRSP